MRLKRIFDHSSGKPVLSHVNVITAPEIQKFSKKFVEQQMASGLLSVANGRFTIKTAEGQPDLVYQIVTGPGLYCAHCNAAQGDSKSAADHVAKEHKDVKSPDKNNPSGYRQDNFYTAKKVS